MFWIITTIILGIITLLLLISNNIKNDRIETLEYALVKGASDEVLKKAVEEYKRYK